MRFRTLFAFILISALAFAQAGGGAKKESPKPEPAKPAAAQPPAAATNAPPPMPRPEPEMEKFTRQMSGRWDVDEDYADTPMAPGGGKGKGIAMSHPGPGGLSLITDYRTVSSQGLIGHGMISWYPRDKAFVSYWMDNMLPGGSVSTGHWKGDDLVFDSVEEMNGQKVQFRMTYTDIKPDSFTLTMDFAPVGKTQFSRMATYKYTRGTPMMGPRFGPRPMRGATPPPGAEPQPDKDKPKL